jgi:hypothetical protein
MDKIPIARLGETILFDPIHLIQINLLLLSWTLALVVYGVRPAQADIGVMVEGTFRVSSHVSKPFVVGRFDTRAV